MCVTELTFVMLATLSFSPRGSCEYEEEGLMLEQSVVPQTIFIWFLSGKTRSKKFFAIDSSVVNVVVLCSSASLCHSQPLKFCLIPGKLHPVFRRAQGIQIAKLGGRESLQEAELRSRGCVFMVDSAV